jgi:hypothetical protein
MATNVIFISVSQSAPDACRFYLVAFRLESVVSRPDVTTPAYVL